MTIKKAIEVLRKHNEWRLGSEIPMIEPKELTEAIRVILEHINPTLEPPIYIVQPSIEREIEINIGFSPI